MTHTYYVSCLCLKNVYKVHGATAADSVQSIHTLHKVNFQSMESVCLQDLVSDFCFDNPLEDTKSIVDLLNDNDLLLFESNVSTLGEQSADADYVGHIQQGVINFSVSKILNTIQHEETEPEIHPSTTITTSQEPSADHVPESEEMPNSLSCAICGKPALRYSSYGGQACTSCRSFFRRSARNDVYLNYK